MSFDSARTDSTIQVESPTSALNLEDRYREWDKEHVRMKERLPKDGKQYLRHARNLLPFLEGVAELHPVVKAVVFSFRAVINIQNDRIENDIRVQNVLYTKADMMRIVLEQVSISLDYHNILTKRRKGTDILSNCHLQDRLRTIGEDIKACGNAIDTYNKERKFVRFYKSVQWKEAMSEWNATFIGHRNALSNLLSLRTAKGVDDLNAKMDQVLEHVFELNDAEKRAQQQLRQYGRKTEKWINDPKKLEKLCSIFDDDQLDDDMFSSEFNGIEDSARQLRLIRSLKEDIEASVETLCNRNKTVFMKKLEFQTAQLEEAISNSATYIVGQLSGPHDRLHHQDLRQLWKEMNWIFCVDGKTFSLALYEYYLDLYSGKGGKDGNGVDTAEKKLNEWTLEYLAAHGKEIHESIDSDMSGYVRISEVNAFTAEMPEGWSFPQWCVYNGIGRHYEQHLYVKRIQYLLDRLHEAPAQVLPWNRYIFHRDLTKGINSLHDLSRGPQISYRYNDLPISFLELIQKKVEEECKLNRAHFKTFHGYLDSVDVVHLIYQKKPVEKYILQLAVFVLEHILSIAEICRTEIVHLFDILNVNTTVNTLKTVVIQHIRKLENIFRDKQADAPAGIKSFHGGIYRVFFDETDYDADNELTAQPPWSDEETDLRDLDFDLLCDIEWPECVADKDVLMYPTWQDYSPDADPHEAPPMQWAVDESGVPPIEEPMAESLREIGAISLFPWHSYGCNNCETSPIVEQAAYHCIDCEDHAFDLCHECFLRPFEQLKTTLQDGRSHLPTHTLIKTQLFLEPGSYRRYIRASAKLNLRWALEDYFYGDQLSFLEDDDEGLEEQEQEVEEEEGGTPSTPSWHVDCNVCGESVTNEPYFFKCIHRLCDDDHYMCRGCGENHEFPSDPHTEEEYLDADLLVEDASEDGENEEDQGNDGEDELDDEEEGHDEGDDNDEGDGKATPGPLAGPKPKGSLHKSWHTLIVIPTQVKEQKLGIPDNVAIGSREAEGEVLSVGNDGGERRIAKLEERMARMESTMDQVKEMLAELLSRGSY